MSTTTINVAFYAWTAAVGVDNLFGMLAIISVILISAALIDVLTAKKDNS